MGVMEAQVELSPMEMWVTALRSGAYKQTRNALHDSDGFSCLDVACDIYDKRFPGKLRIDIIDQGIHAYEGNIKRLPQKVKDWLGLVSGIGEYGNRQSLIYDNDYRILNFSEIADIIERRPPRLFKRETTSNVAWS